MVEILPRNEMPSTVSEVNRAKFGPEPAYAAPAESLDDSKAVKSSKTIGWFIALWAFAIITVFIPFLNLVLSPILFVLGIYLAWKIRKPYMNVEA